MKSVLAILLLTTSVCAFSNVDTCPLHQDLIRIKDNFQLILKPKKDFDGDITLAKGNSTFTVSSKTISLKKGQEVPLFFMNEKFKIDDLSFENTVSGIILLDNGLKSNSFKIDSITKVTFKTKSNYQELPTVTDLHNVVGDDFEISCKRNIDDIEAHSTDSTATSSPQ